MQPLESLLFFNYYPYCEELRWTEIRKAKAKSRTTRKKCRRRQKKNFHARGTFFFSWQKIPFFVMKKKMFRERKNFFCRFFRVERQKRQKATKSDKKSFFFFVAGRQFFRVVQLLPFQKSTADKKKSTA